MSALKVIEIIDLAKSFDIAYPKTVSVASNGLDKIYLYERVSESILCVEDLTQYSRIEIDPELHPRHIAADPETIYLSARTLGGIDRLNSKSLLVEPPIEIDHEGPCSPGKISVTPQGLLTAIETRANISLILIDAVGVKLWERQCDIGPRLSVGANPVYPGFLAGFHYAVSDHDILKLERYDASGNYAGSEDIAVTENDPIEYRTPEGKSLTSYRVCLSDVASSEEAQALFILYKRPAGNYLLMYRWGQGAVAFPLPWDVRSICAHGSQLIVCGDWSLFLFKMPRWELGAPLRTVFS